MEKENWSKKEGYDLRWDKRTILAKELKKSGGATTKKLPKIADKQVHKLKEWHLHYKYDKGGKPRRHKKLKAKIFNGIASLYGTDDIDRKCKRLRKLEGFMYHVLTNRGSFDEAEAEKIVDAYMICRERKDPTHHPLQTATISGVKYKSHSSIQNRTIFSQPAVRRSLAKRGFYLNNGPFSETETLTLMKNFEKFLTVRGKPTDKESIWNLLHDEFLQFYRKTKMFLYVGKGLNRSTFQIYMRLFSLYHPYIDGKSDAKTDAYIMERAPALEGLGLHRKFKAIGEEVNRYRYFVHDRYKLMVKQKDGFDKETTEKIKTELALYRKSAYGRKSSVDGVDDVPFSTIAEKLGVSEKKLRAYWNHRGRKNAARADLPRWTLKDSRTLFTEIQREEEEDENCIDFEDICRRVFVGKVENWQHLREHYNRVRRRVSFYLVKDLPSVVRIVLKDIRERMEKAGEGGEDEEEEDEDGGAEENLEMEVEKGSEGVEEKKEEVGEDEEDTDGEEEEDSEEETDDEEETDSEEEPGTSMEEERQPEMKRLETRAETKENEGGEEEETDSEEEETELDSEEEAERETEDKEKGSVEKIEKERKEETSSQEAETDSDDEEETDSEEEDETDSEEETEAKTKVLSTRENNEKVGSVKMAENQEEDSEEETDSELESN